MGTISDATVGRLELETIFRDRPLTFPITDNAAFVRQLVAGGGDVTFRGVAYKADFGAGLVPKFFFPFRSAEEMMTRLTELLAARGLVPLPEGRRKATGGPVPGGGATQPEKVANSVAQRLSRRPSGGKIDPDTAGALDVVTHALEFTGEVDALDLWRVALWEGRLADRARESVVRMAEHLLHATARGESDAIGKICDCLHHIFESREAGGIRFSTTDDGRQRTAEN